MGREPICIIEGAIASRILPNDHSCNSLMIPNRPDVADIQDHVQPNQLDLAKRWLETCLESHDTCKRCDDYTMPTRLIAVDEGSARLVATTGWDPAVRPRYATLSHCWGGINFLKLTTTTLELFTKEIPLKQLTKTFRETIAVVRELGVPYLWIDSLCIIQDDLQDWEVESTLMSSIYVNSTITIAATGAVNGLAGLFLRPKGYVGKVHVDASTDSGTEGWDFAAPTYERSITWSALAKRAWALQERLLSPRVLHFTDTEIYWEYKSKLACESFPEGLPKEHARVDGFQDNKASLYDNWSSIVQSYTEADLTFGSDKLVAIAGIARVAQKENNGDYLAGMWRHEIEDQLPWMPRGRGARTCSSSSGETYRAPTWSWACSDQEIWWQPVAWLNKGRKFVAHVLDAWVVPLETNTSDVFGQLRGGTLTMSCSAMLSGKITSGDHPEGARILEVQTATLFPVRVRPDTKIEDDGQVLYLLPVMHRPFYQGLLLRPSGIKKGEFSRIGWFLPHVNPDSGCGDDVEYEDVVNELHTNGAPIAGSCCAEVIAQPKYPGERFLITII